MSLVAAQFRIKVDLNVLFRQSLQDVPTSFDNQEKDVHHFHVFSVIAVARNVQIAGLDIGE